MNFFASPWWVNLCALAPFVAFRAWRRGLRITRSQLLWAGVFAIAFGFLEGCVVVYLRAAGDLLPGFHNTLAEVQRHSREISDAQLTLLNTFPSSLLSVEVAREASTMVMLAAVALLATRGTAERWAMFMWCFAWWDITYYAGLWATIRWPRSLASPDVLFLIPVPWLAQVWFPILVSALTLAAVAARRREFSQP